MNYDSAGTRGASPKPLQHDIPTRAALTPFGEGRVMSSNYVIRKVRK